MPEASDADLVLYHAPRTRSFTALWLLEELGVPFRLEGFDISTGRHKKPDYLALNPMGKVPMVVHRGTPVSELGAIAIYLSDIYPDAGLAPALDDLRRPAYLRWIFFSSAIIEPAYAQKFFDWSPPPSSVAWGSYDQMKEVVTSGVSTGTWLTGDQLTAADILVGAGLRFGQLFGAMPSEGPTADFVKRLTDRDAFRRAEAIEQRQGERFPPPQ